MFESRAALTVLLAVISLGCSEDKVVVECSLVGHGGGGEVQYFVAAAGDPCAVGATGNASVDTEAKIRVQQRTRAAVNIVVQDALMSWSGTVDFSSPENCQLQPSARARCGQADGGLADSGTIDSAVRDGSHSPDASHSSDASHDGATQDASTDVRFCAPGPHEGFGTCSQTGSGSGSCRLVGEPPPASATSLEGFDLATGIEGDALELTGAIPIPGDDGEGGWLITSYLASQEIYHFAMRGYLKWPPSVPDQTTCFARMTRSLPSSAFKNAFYPCINSKLEPWMTAKVAPGRLGNISCQPDQWVCFYVAYDALANEVTYEIGGSSTTVKYNDSTANSLTGLYLGSFSNGISEGRSLLIDHVEYTNDEDKVTSGALRCRP